MQFFSLFDCWAMNFPYTKQNAIAVVIFSQKISCVIQSVSDYTPEFLTYIPVYSSDC